MRAALALALLLTTAPALADEEFVVTPGDGPRCLREFPGAPQENGLEPYFIDPLGAGFVAYQTVSSGQQRRMYVIEDCTHRERMAWSGPADLALWPTRAGLDLYESMVHGDEPFTLREIADRLAAIGEHTGIARGGFESCGCRLIRDN